MTPAPRTVAVATLATLGLGILWRLSYPVSALSAVFPGIVALVSFHVGARDALRRHVAFRSAWLIPGTFAARILTGRAGAALAGLIAALAGLPLAYFTITASPAELLAAALAIPILAAALLCLRRRLGGQIRPDFVGPSAAALLVLVSGLPLVLVFAWLGYAVAPRPGVLDQPTLQAALAADLARLPGHVLAEPVAAARLVEVALWWSLDRSGYNLWLTLAVLIRNALFALALVRVAADMTTMTADIRFRRPTP